MKLLVAAVVVVVLLVAAWVRRRRRAAMALIRDTPPAGALELLRGDAVAAVALAEAAVTTHPADFRPHVVLACAALESQRFDEASAHLLRAEERAADSDEVRLLEALVDRRRAHPAEPQLQSFLEALRQSRLSCDPRRARLPVLQVRREVPLDARASFVMRAVQGVGRGDALVVEAMALDTAKLDPLSALFALDALGGFEANPERDGSRAALARVFVDSRPDDLAAALLSVAFGASANAALTEAELAMLEDAVARRQFRPHALDAYQFLFDELASLGRNAAAEAAFSELVAIYPAPFNYRLQHRLKATLAVDARQRLRVATLADALAEKTSDLPTTLDRSWARSWAGLADSAAPSLARKETAKKLNASFERLAEEANAAFNSVSRFPLPSLLVELHLRKAADELGLVAAFRETGCLGLGAKTPA